MILERCHCNYYDDNDDDDDDYDDDDEQPADKVTGENRKRPLGEKLPDGTKVEDNHGYFWTLTGAIELHRLVLKDEFLYILNTLKMQKDGITRTIIDSTCAIEDGHGKHYKEVSQSPLPPYILKASTTTPTGPQKNLNFPQICPEMPRNGPKMAKNDPKWSKYNPKWPHKA